MKNRIGIAFLLILLGGLSSMGPLFAQSTAPTVGLRSAVETAAAGEEIAVEITLTDAEEIYGVSFRLSYDPLAYEVVTVNESVVQMGDFFAGEPSFTVVNRVEETLGEIEYAMTLTRPALPQSGNGTIGRVTLRALNAGPVVLQLLDVNLLTPTFEEVNGELIASGVVEIPATVQDSVSLNTASPATAESGAPSDIAAFLQGAKQAESDAALVTSDSASSDLSIQPLVPVGLLIFGLVLLLLGIVVYRRMRQSMIQAERS